MCGQLSCDVADRRDTVMVIVCKHALDPKVFWDQWMQYSLVSPTPIKSYFVPHRIERKKWEFVARKAGIIFDRCRIAFWAQQEKVDYGPHVEWIRDLLTQMTP